MIDELCGFSCSASKTLLICLALWTECTLGGYEFVSNERDSSNNEQCGQSTTLPPLSTECTMHSFIDSRNRVRQFEVTYPSFVSVKQNTEQVVMDSSLDGVYHMVFVNITADNTEDYISVTLRQSCDFDLPSVDSSSSKHLLKFQSKKSDDQTQFTMVLPPCQRHSISDDSDAAIPSDDGDQSSGQSGSENRRRMGEGQRSYPKRRGSVTEAPSKGDDSTPEKTSSKLCTFYVVVQASDEGIDYLTNSRHRSLTFSIRQQLGVILEFNTDRLLYSPSPEQVSFFSDSHDDASDTSEASFAEIVSSSALSSLLSGINGMHWKLRNFLDRALSDFLFDRPDKPISQVRGSLQTDLAVGSGKYRRSRVSVNSELSRQSGDISNATTVECYYRQLYGVLADKSDFPVGLILQREDTSALSDFTGSASPVGTGDSVEVVIYQTDSRPLSKVITVSNQHKGQSMTVNRRKPKGWTNGFTDYLLYSVQAEDLSYQVYAQPNLTNFQKLVMNGAGWFVFVAFVALMAAAVFRRKHVASRRRRWQRRFRLAVHSGSPAKWCCIGVCACCCCCGTMVESWCVDTLCLSAERRRRQEMREQQRRQERAQDGVERASVSVRDQSEDTREVELSTVVSHSLETDHDLDDEDMDDDDELRLDFVQFADSIRFAFARGRSQSSVTQLSFGTVDTENNQDASEQRPKGASAEEINGLTLETYGLKHRQSKYRLKYSNCSVCLEKYQNGDLLRKLRCCHLFHQSCIDPWLKMRDFCPLCKQCISDAKNVHGRPDTDDCRSSTNLSSLTLRITSTEGSSSEDSSTSIMESSDCSSEKVLDRPKDRRQLSAVTEEGLRSEEWKSGESSSNNSDPELDLNRVFGSERWKGDRTGDSGSLTLILDSARLCFDECEEGTDLGMDADVEVPDLVLPVERDGCLDDIPGLISATTMAEHALKLSKDVLGAQHSGRRPKRWRRNFRATSMPLSEKVDHCADVEVGSPPPHSSGSPKKKKQNPRWKRKWPRLWKQPESEHHSRSSQRSREVEMEKRSKQDCKDTDSMDDWFDSLMVVSPAKEAGGGIERIRSVSDGCLVSRLSNPLVTADGVRQRTPVNPPLPSAEVPRIDPASMDADSTPESAPSSAKKRSLNGMVGLKFRKTRME